MKRIYRIVAGVLAALGGFAAVGAGAMIVATAIVIGFLAAMTARLAIKGKVADTGVDAPFEAKPAPV